MWPHVGKVRTELFLFFHRRRRDHILMCLLQEPRANASHQDKTRQHICNALRKCGLFLQRGRAASRRLKPAPSSKAGKRPPDGCSGGNHNGDPRHDGMSRATAKSPLRPCENARSVAVPPTTSSNVRSCGQLEALSRATRPRRNNTCRDTRNRYHHRRFLAKATRAVWLHVLPRSAPQETQKSSDAQVLDHCNPDSGS